MYILGMVEFTEEDSSLSLGLKIMKTNLHAQGFLKRNFFASSLSLISVLIKVSTFDYRKVGGIHTPLLVINSCLKGENGRELLMKFTVKNRNTLIAFTYTDN